MQYSITNYSHHAVPHIPMTHLFFNWKFLYFYFLHLFGPPFSPCLRQTPICYLSMILAFCLFLIFYSAYDHLYSINTLKRLVGSHKKKCTIYHNKALRLLEKVIFLFTQTFRSTYRWDYTVCVFLCLTYFTWRNALKVHRCCHKWRDFILLHGWIIFHWLYTTLSLSIHLLMDTLVLSVS